MNAQNLAALITAVAGLVTAIGAVIHSQNTRSALKTHHKLTKGVTRPDAGPGGAAHPSGRAH